MTIVAAKAAEMDMVDTAIDQVGPDADVGFWSMFPASAEQVTVQIRTVLDRAWEFIALAYKGRAFISLGYPNWDASVGARFGDLPTAVPREHRTQVVAELAGVRMSCRAIAKVLGVGVATVHREFTRNSLGDPSAIVDGDGVGVVNGRDGKEPNNPAPAGSNHQRLHVRPAENTTRNNPAAVRGTCSLKASRRIRGGPVPEASAGEDTTYGPPQMPDPHAGRPGRENVATPRVTDSGPTDIASRPTGLETLTGFVAQLEAVLEEVSGLDDVVRAIEETTTDYAAGCSVSLERRIRMLGRPRSRCCRLGRPRRSSEAGGRHDPVELMTDNEPAGADRVSDGLVVRGRPPFAMTPTSMLRTPEVSSHAVRLWSVLASYTYGDRATDRPSRAQLAADVGRKSPRSVDGYLTELQDAGYLTVQRRWRPDGGKARNVYILEWDPANVPPRTGQTVRTLSTTLFPQLGPRRRILRLEVPRKLARLWISRRCRSGPCARSCVWGHDAGHPCARFCACPWAEFCASWRRTNNEE